MQFEDSKMAEIPQCVGVVLAAASTAGLSLYESGTEGLDSHSMSSFLLQNSRKLS